VRLSLVTACLNARATIGEALASVRGQTRPPLEHIVVDGASTDGTLEVLERHRAGLRLVSEPDAGLYHAMNKGLALAAGDYVGFLNADDLYSEAGVLERVAKALAGGADAVYGDLVYVRREDTRRVVRYWRSRPYAGGLIERGWMPPHPAFFVRTAILRKLGGFDTRYRFQADFELMVRLFLKERIVSVHVPHVLVRMRLGGHSNRSAGNILRGNLEARRACRENGVTVSPFFVLRKILSRLPQFFARPPHWAPPPDWPPP